ncbi:hypothetical protein Tco_1052797 [Tanacetum coccineum]
MVAYLEKSDENAEFHQIVDFLSTCSINYALTISPTIYSSYIKQFWNTATSKIVNSVKQIHVIVDGKAIVITESSLRNDLFFDDEDGITCLTNDEIFENLALMGCSRILPEHRCTGDASGRAAADRQSSGGCKTIRSIRGHRGRTQKPYMTKAKKSVGLNKYSEVYCPVQRGQKAPRNHGGAPAQTRSERVLKQPNEPPLSEGHTSGSGEGRMEHTFELMDIVPPTPHDSPLPRGYTPRSDEGRLKLEELMVMCIKLSKQVLYLEKEKDAQAIEILKLKKIVKKLERQRKSSISHPRRRIYRQVESSDDDFDEEDASKQGRTSDKTKPMFKDSDFYDLDDLVDEGMDFVQEKDAENQGKTIFDDEDVTIAMAQTFIKMKEEKAKEKGVAIKDVEDFSRPIRSITTLQPLPTIDPKDKGKGILQETKPVEKTKKKGSRQEEASKVAITDMFDEVQARIDADYELAARMTHEEQEKYTIEERARLLAEFFKRRKKQLAAERAEAIKNGLYERQQKRIQDFMPIESEKEAQKPAKRLKRVAGSYAT